MIPVLATPSKLQWWHSNSNAPSLTFEPDAGSQRIASGLETGVAYCGVAEEFLVCLECSDHETSAWSTRLIAVNRLTPETVGQKLLDVPVLFTPSNSSGPYGFAFTTIGHAARTGCR